MPKKKESLSAIEIPRINKRGLHAVGEVSGLCLQVSKGGSKSWVLRSMIAGKRRSMGLGGYPDVTLSQARNKAREMKAKVENGIDPILVREQARQAVIAKNQKLLTFSQAAYRKHEAISHEFRSAVHGREWIASLERHAFPIIGDMNVGDVEVPHILKVLEPIWHTKTDTARRVRQRIESVLSWATVSGHREGINSAQWKGNLSELLPSANKIHKVKHQRALDWTDVPEFMVKLRKREGMAAKALEFAILTAARSGEVRGMTWGEVDITAKTWTIDQTRMKANNDHIVPLSSVVIKILKELPRFPDSEFVFPSSNGSMLSDMSMLAVCKRMEVDAVPHGFRSGFKDWARNRTNYADEVSELALAHVNNDATRAAYARDKLLPLRIKLMNEWAQFCEMPFVTGNVIEIGAAKHG